MNPLLLKLMRATMQLALFFLQNNCQIRFFIYKLKSSEKNYYIVEKEIFAVVKALLQFRNIIFGCKIYILTDNRNATFLKITENSRILRWKTIMDEYDYELNHIVGSKNKEADLYQEIFCQCHQNLRH